MKLQTAKFGCLALLVVMLIALLIPVCGFWIRGYWVTDDIGFHRPARFTRIRTSGGGLWFETRSWPEYNQNRNDWEQFQQIPYPFLANEKSSFFERCGFLFSTQGYDLVFVLPYWAVVGTMTACLSLVVVALCRQPARVEQG